jgi:signal-transduction protein with cAMP-binding, CBS, and nucleotidyltransferase domain
MITQTDMLSRVLALARNAETTKAKTVMSEPLVCGSPSMDFIEATRLMVDRGVKKLPITHGERLVGILTITDAIAVHPHAPVRRRGGKVTSHSDIHEEIVEEIARNCPPFLPDGQGCPRSACYCLR